jgi:hypothetical protein
MKIKCIRCDELYNETIRRHQNSVTFRCDNCGFINYYSIQGNEVVSRI